METLFKLFANRQTFVIAGRHYGILVEQVEIPENIFIFISFGDMDQHLRKIKLDALR